MRLRVASDRAYRSFYKTLSSATALSTFRRRRTLSGGHPRDLDTFAASEHQPIRRRDILFFLLSFVFFLHSLISYFQGRVYRPQEGWRWRGAASGSVAVVSACNDGPAITTTLESLSRGVLPASVAIPANISNLPNIPKLTLSQIEGHWAPGSALNLAAARANAQWILLLPCGCSAPEKFPGELSEDFFYFARLDADEDLCQRAILLQKKNFLRIRGADERISGEWDPSLQSRLRSSALRYREMHLTSSHRAYDAEEHVQLLSDRLAQRGAPPWSGQTPEQQRPKDVYEAALYDRWMRRSRRGRFAAEYSVSRDGVFRPLRVALPLIAFLPDGSEKQARTLALREALRARYRIPRAVSIGMSTRTLERLHAALSGAETGKEILPRIVVAHVQHGLGNRLRALGSAVAFARATGRLAVVIWERDAHCEARLSALFEESERFFVSQIGPDWPLNMEIRADDTWGFWTTFNYMEAEGAGANKDEEVDAPSDRHVYFKSAFALRAKQRGVSTWTSANAEIRALRPVPAVTAMGTMGRRAGMIGVHVRALPVDGEIIGASYVMNATKLLKYWRAKSAASVFAAEMQRISKAEPGVTFLVAADSESARVELRKVRGATVMDGCDGRGEVCVQKALAELLALAHTTRFLGSPWSSFSEAVVRLGGGEMRVAGIDFAVDRVEDVLKDHGEEVARVVAEVHRRRAEKLKKRQHL